MIKSLLESVPQGLLDVIGHSSVVILCESERRPALFSALSSQ